MPGFVDVSGWSAQDVKRLGQMDDDDFSVSYRNPYAYRKPVKRVTKPVINYNADDVWAAAVQAQSINGAYIKSLAPGVTQPHTNRQIVERLLSDPIQIKQESRDKAVLVRQYFKGLTFKVLKGTPLSEFGQAAMEISNKDAITSNYEIAVICSLPASYEKSVKRDDVDRRINFARGGHIGSIGDKVNVDIEVIKQFWSDKWNTWYVTGITDDDKVVFFAFKNQLTIGDRVNVAGTVKGHRDTSTQLNRVKIV